MGRLTGGIAHDLNNVMTAVRAYADLLAGDMTDNDRRMEDVQGIRHAAERAGALTHQLLAFSRAMPSQTKPVDTSRAGNLRAVPQTMPQACEQPDFKLWRTR